MAARHVGIALLRRGAFAWARCLEEVRGRPQKGDGQEGQEGPEGPEEVIFYRAREALRVVGRYLAAQTAVSFIA